MNAIADAYIDACRLELDSLKPGNVHRQSEGHGMTCRDFEISAEVSAPMVTRHGASVGERIFEAVAATKAAVGVNTNLGIILLSAPLATAAESEQPLWRILEMLTVDDARKCFAAISAANPGGLGSVRNHDVRTAATAPLSEVMAAAAERDLVARQYAYDFVDIFGLGLSHWYDARAQGHSSSKATTTVYLAFLRTFPDTHIARKFGIDAANSLWRETRRRASEVPELEPARRDYLLAWDADLKMRGLNPGACADLTVATIFAAFLAERTPNILRLPPNSGLNKERGAPSRLSGQPILRPPQDADNKDS